MISFRELESTALYAGLGVKLVDDFASVPEIKLEAAPTGWTSIEIDVEDGAGWRTLDPASLSPARTPGNVVWFPWLEHYADARGRVPRKYRVRVTAGFYTPLYSYDADGIEFSVPPYDDVNAPAASSEPVRVHLVPADNYPFPPDVPVLRGAIIDTSSVPVRLARVQWAEASVTRNDIVLTDGDGEFALPMRRAPLDTPIEIIAERPGQLADVIVRIPQDLSTFHTIQIS